MRTAVAYAISAIAHWDWPENWPGLFDILVVFLSGENEYAVHGAMRVLTEFTRDLGDNHLPSIGPIILQEMYRIFQSENVKHILLFFTIIILIIYQRIICKLVSIIAAILDSRSWKSR